MRAQIPAILLSVRNSGGTIGATWGVGWLARGTRSDEAEIRLGGSIGAVAWLCRKGIDKSLEV